MTKVDYRGYTLDARTVAMIEWAEKKAGFKFRISQGSYNVGGVAASAGTHDGGGVVDFSCRLLTPRKRRAMVDALKNAGFAAWHRKKRLGIWTEHVHAVAIGCTDLAPLAKKQVKEFDLRLDGLAGRNVDLTYRPTPPVKFSLPMNHPVVRKS
jgi:hypothetical protein